MLHLYSLLASVGWRQSPAQVNMACMYLVQRDVEALAHLGLGVADMGGLGKNPDAYDVLKQMMYTDSPQLKTTIINQH